MEAEMTTPGQAPVASVAEAAERSHFALRRAVVDVAMGLLHAGVLSHSRHADLSARVGPDTVLIATLNRTRDLVPDDLAVVRLDGSVAEGDLGGMSTEVVAMHTGVYRARSQVGAVIHAHSPGLLAFALAGRPLPVRYEPLPRLGQAEEVPVAPSAPVGAVIELIKARPGTQAVLLGGHGVLAFGPDAETTVSLLVALEEAAEAELRTAVLGRLSAPPDNGIHVVKVMLNLSKREQAKRFLKRIDHPEKNWKFSPSDVRERRYWDDYQQAFEDMLSHTSTKCAPWYVVPADHKWFSRLATAAVLVTALDAINPRYPAPDPAVADQMAQVRVELAAALGRTGPGSSPGGWGFPAGRRCHGWLWSVSSSLPSWGTIVTGQRDLSRTYWLAVPGITAMPVRAASTTSWACVWRAVSMITCPVSPAETRSSVCPAWSPSSSSTVARSSASAVARCSPPVCIAEPGKPPTGPIGGSYALTAMRGACRQRASCAASRSASLEASE
jgi:L-ribulose-5-phosphate 4-epimerase